MTTKMHARFRAQNLYLRSELLAQGEDQRIAAISRCNWRVLRTWRAKWPSFPGNRQGRLGRRCGGPQIGGRAHRHEASRNAGGTTMYPIRSGGNNVLLGDPDVDHARAAVQTLQ